MVVSPRFRSTGYVWANVFHSCSMATAVVDRRWTGYPKVQVPADLRSCKHYKICSVYAGEQPAIFHNLLVFMTPSLVVHVPMRSKVFRNGWEHARGVLKSFSSY